MFQMGWGTNHQLGWVITEIWDQHQLTKVNSHVFLPNFEGPLLNYHEPPFFRDFFPSQMQGKI